MGEQGRCTLLSMQKEAHHLAESWKLAGTENIRRNDVLIILMPKWLIQQRLLCIRRMWHKKWDKLFENGLSKFCGRQPLKNLKGYGLLKHTITLQNF